MKNFDERLQQAVRASAAHPSEDFLDRMGQMIDRLPRKERPIVKRKLSVGLALAILLCLLTLGALAVALLTNEQLVEQTVLPMAQQNDTDGLNETFTNEELGKILALAEENGIDLAADAHIRSAYNAGKGYWEQEVIMAIAKEAFGPYPGQWTLEQQYWFEEVMVAIGFKEYNAARIPGPDDLTFDAAYAIARNHVAAAHALAPDDLDDRAQYALWLGYHAYLDEAGNPKEPTWYFWFEGRDLDHGDYTVFLDRAGTVTDTRYTPAFMTDRMKAGLYTAQEADYRFEYLYGPKDTWTPREWQQYEAQLDQATDADTFLLAQVDYIDIPEGGLTQEEIAARAIAAVTGENPRVGSSVCMMDGDRAIWKVNVWTDGPRKHQFELDCMTGEVLRRCKLIPDVWADYVPAALWEAWEAKE